MTRILIRCDASLMIGSGHVMRCRTLARELQRRGAEVIFLCRRQPGNLISLLEPEFAVLALPEQTLTACSELDGRDLYRAWLGCTQEQDAAQCLEVLAEACITGASWLVVDHYGLDARWEELLIADLAIGEVKPKLLAIDDLADRSHQSHLLLDQNFFGEATHNRYIKRVPKHCRQLLGPKYALLTPEYALLHSLLPTRTELKRVLIYFGAVDPLGLTSLSLEALSSKEFLDVSVDVVIGRLDSNCENIHKLVRSRPNTTLHKPLQSLAGLIARADLSIGAGGSTTWERACLGLPSLVIATASNQLAFAELLDKSGHLKLIGNGSRVTMAEIRNALTEMDDNLALYSSCKSLTNGRGVQDLAQALLSDQESNLTLGL